MANKFQSPKMGNSPYTSTGGNVTADWGNHTKGHLQNIQNRNDNAVDKPGASSQISLSNS